MTMAFTPDVWLLMSAIIFPYVHLRTVWCFGARKSQEAQKPGGWGAAWGTTAESGESYTISFLSK